MYNFIAKVECIIVLFDLIIAVLLLKTVIV